MSQMCPPLEGKQETLSVVQLWCVRRDLVNSFSSALSNYFSCPCSSLSPIFHRLAFWYYSFLMYLHPYGHNFNIWQYLRWLLGLFPFRVKLRQKLKIWKDTLYKHVSINTNYLPVFVFLTKLPITLTKQVLL